MPQCNELNYSKYGDLSDFIEIKPFTVGNELCVDICRVMQESDVRCVNVIIRGGTITIKGNGPDAEFDINLGSQ